MPDRRRYNQLVVAATHNSYAGKPSGDLGSISHQLDRGVRFVELDVHDNDFTHFGYRIGHESPGDGVVHGGGNPASDRLPDWLQIIVNWSGNHAGHVPIVVLLDVKDPLTDNRSFAAGNLGRLNAEIVGHIPRLFTAEELAVAAWPSVAALRDRVIVVLSGDAGNRPGWRAAFPEAVAALPAYQPDATVEQWRAAWDEWTRRFPEAAARRAEVWRPVEDFLE